MFVSILTNIHLLKEKNIYQLTWEKNLEKNNLFYLRMINTRENKLSLSEIVYSSYLNNNAY